MSKLIPKCQSNDDNAFGNLRDRLDDRTYYATTSFEPVVTASKLKRISGFLDGQSYADPDLTLVNPISVEIKPLKEAGNVDKTGIRKGVFHPDQNGNIVFTPVIDLEKDANTYSANEAGASVSGAMGEAGKTLLPYTLGLGNPLSFAYSMIGGSVADEFAKLGTDATGRHYTGWGDMVHDKTGINETLADFTNPGYLLNPEVAVNTVNGVKSGLKTASRVYNAYKINPNGFKNIYNDITTYPDDVVKARFNGEYPLTYAERKLYILDRNNAIQSALDYNLNRGLADDVVSQSSYNTKLSALKDATDYAVTLFGLESPEAVMAKSLLAYFKANAFTPEVRDVGARTAQRFNLSEGASGHAETWNDRIVLRRRNFNSNLPATAINGPDFNNLKHLSAHEFNHIIMGNTYKPPLKTYNPTLKYYQPSTFLENSPFAKNLSKVERLTESVKNTGEITPALHYRIWQLSPEEFQSELTGARATNVSPAKINTFLQRRFNLSEPEVTERIAWLDANGYRSGGKLNYFK